MDDATSEIYSAFFVDEEGTMSSLRGVFDVIESRGLFSSFYTDRGSHYWFTPEAGGKVDKQNLTQFGRALQQLNIEHIPAYSPEARGRSERMFGTLQGRLPQELRLAGISDMDTANRYLKEVYMPKHNKIFSIPPEEQGSAFVAFTGNRKDTLCVQVERVVGNDNTVQFKKLVLKIPEGKHRHHYVKARVCVHQYFDNSLAIFHGPRQLAAYDKNGNLSGSKDKLAA